MQQEELKLILSAKLLRRVREEEERLRREARQEVLKVAPRFCSIKDQSQKVVTVQEGHCLSRGAVCRSGGLLYPDEVNNKQKHELYRR